MAESRRDRLLREAPERLKRLSDRDLAILAHDWEFWARPNQLPPPGDWRYWMVLAGRGFGKTRIGAEWVRLMARTSRHITIVGATINDARTIMVEGESGILACCPDGERPKYMAHKGELHWPNGSKTQVMSGDNLPITKVRASQGKYARAEPVATLYERGRVSHVGFFADLEDQLCDYVPGEGRRSPDRLDALVWALTHLMPATGGTYAAG